MLHEHDWAAMSRAKDELAAALRTAGCVRAWVDITEYRCDMSDLGNLHEFVVDNRRYLRAALAAAIWPESVHIVYELLFRFGLLIGVPREKM